MNTLIIHKSYISDNQKNKDLRFFNIGIYYSGVYNLLRISCKYETKINFSKLSSPFITISGNFQEKIKPYRLELNNATLKEFDFSEEINWKNFIVEKLIEYNIPMLTSETSDFFSLGSLLESHYLSFELSKNYNTIEKAEFGRFMPLQNKKYVRKETSWTKGVFVNDRKKSKVKFMQTSWFGENSAKYKLKYSKKSKIHLDKFLQIPLETGWIEKDYYIGKSEIYKASGKLIGDEQEDVFTLKGIEEQDIPLFQDLFLIPLRRIIGDFLSIIGLGRTRINNVEKIKIPTANTV